MATMFVTDEMIKRAKELADELFYDFECIGIRVQDGIPFELGNLDHTSKVWDNGEETDVDLDGFALSVSMTLRILKPIMVIMPLLSLAICANMAKIRANL